MGDFTRFPSTPHLMRSTADGPVRGDKLLPPEEIETLLAAELIVAEKVDGANVGIGIREDGEVRVQVRGQFIQPGAHPQFGPLWAWIDQRRGQLTEALGTGLTLFGEWTFARHTVAYDQLPDYLLVFDVRDDASQRFWSVPRRNELCERVDALHVPELARGRFTLDELGQLLGESQLAAATEMEGIYVRRDSEAWLEQRAKLVRSGFIQSDAEHWSARDIERNLLRDG